MMIKKAGRTGTITRRRILKAMFCGAAAAPLACAMDGYLLEPEWLQVIPVDLPLPRLDPVFAGKRIVQISDLHHSDTVGAAYLNRCIDRVNTLDPDWVVLTGDYITTDHDNRFIDGVLEIIGRLANPRSVYAVCGNHDYGIWHTGQPVNRRNLSAITEGMAARNINVLQNKSVALTLSGRRLWLVGLGDFWGGDLKPKPAFADVATTEPRVALVHNPDALDHLVGFNADAFLCGHTHGGQVRLPFFGPPILPVHNRRYSAGMYKNPARLLYINRGLGRFGGIQGRVRFNCRPEITVFTLRSAVGM